MMSLTEISLCNETKHDLPQSRLMSTLCVSRLSTPFVSDTEYRVTYARNLHVTGNSVWNRFVTFALFTKPLHLLGYNRIREDIIIVFSPVKFLLVLTTDDKQNRETPV